MADLADVSSLATAGGTLVLALATFWSVRSANRAARIAERTLLAGIRPVLAPSRLQDPEQKITWQDEHWTRLPGGRAGVEVDGDVIYLSFGLRNVGAGMGVLHGWLVWPERDTQRGRPEPEDFRRQQRDLYVPAGDLGFWQGAIRELTDPVFEPLAAAIAGRERFDIELLYGDHDGGQRTITRFGIFPAGEADVWMFGVSRHWNLDRPDPR